jgi:peptide deformylase
MAVLPILITGDPVLHSPASPVVSFDASLAQLVRDMEETMAAAPGVGLDQGAAINPELLISPLSLDELDEDEESEGCLSLPGERFPLRRAERALLRATSLDGTPYEISATGWLARIFQHEYDHLDGVLYSDRLAHPDDRAAAKVIKKRSWGVPGQSWLPGVEHLEG